MRCRTLDLLGGAVRDDDQLLPVRQRGHLIGIIQNVPLGEERPLLQLNCLVTLMQVARLLKLPRFVISMRKSLMFPVG